MTKRNCYLHIGGVVAVGFDTSGDHLLVISHSGRGVYSTQTWERVARDTELSYPTDGIGIGIGPIDGEQIPINEMNDETGEMKFVAPSQEFTLLCESSGIEVCYDN